MLCERDLAQRPVHQHISLSRYNAPHYRGREPHSPLMRYSLRGLRCMRLLCLPNHLAAPCLSGLCRARAVLILPSPWLALIIPGASATWRSDGSISTFRCGGITTRVTERGVSDWPMHTTPRYRASVNALVRRTKYLAAPYAAPPRSRRTKGGWFCHSLFPHYGERGWRGGGMKDRTEKRSIFAIGGQVIASISAYVRLTLGVTGPRTMN